jgi:hypothetical protein
MATLTDTEEEAGKDCRLHSSLLSVGHSFSSCMLWPHGSYPSCAWSSQFAEALVYLQVVVWAFTELLLKPITNPYVPKRKLSSCSQWLQSWLKYTNDAFDNMAIYLDPLIHVKGGHCQGCSHSSQGPVHCKATPSSRSKATPRNQVIATPHSRAHVLMAYSAVTTMLSLVPPPTAQSLTLTLMISWWMEALLPVSPTTSTIL